MTTPMDTSVEMPGVELSSTLTSLLLPGDSVGNLLESSKNSKTDKRSRAVVRLGPGVTQRGRQLVASKCGTMHTDLRRNKLWLHTNQRRYVPALDDMVVAIVSERFSEEYRMDIRGTDTAVLSALAFEGATKKNKPNLAVGTLVYCRVTRASKNMEAEVSCVEPGSARSWVGGETMYGELKGGNLVTVSVGLSRALMKADGNVLAELGKRVPFQCAVGTNGRVWVQADDVKNTMILSEVIRKADELEIEQWRAFVKKLFA